MITQYNSCITKQNERGYLEKIVLQTLESYVKGCMYVIHVSNSIFQFNQEQ